MSIYQQHVFVCLNQKSEPKRCCMMPDTQDFFDQLKQSIAQMGLKPMVRINKSGCLGQCSKGPTLVIYPQGKWYFNACIDDIPVILEEIKQNV